jgi:hypothetical protein
MPVNLGGPAQQQNTPPWIGIICHGIVFNTADGELHELPTILDDVNFKYFKTVAVTVKDLLPWRQLRYGPESDDNRVSSH